ncbi:hypothetical protein T492DRAFT_835714 [Pavlovales sp. CCMP2436]|nr:hypothetical protein T492DRAFT_835714 [Pavlovales sp. CCMP2436]
MYQLLFYQATPTLSSIATVATAPDAAAAAVAAVPKAGVVGAAAAVDLDADLESYRGASMAEGEGGRGLPEFLRAIGRTLPLPRLAHAPSSSVGGQATTTLPARRVPARKRSAVASRLLVLRAVRAARGLWGSVAQLPAPSGGQLALADGRRPTAVVCGGSIDVV